MIKHKLIVDKLSEAQKIQILTDVRCLAEEEYLKLGIPSIKLANIEEYKSDVYPSPRSLANAWNLKVITDVANDISVSMSLEGVTAVNIPSPVAKLNLNDAATSEDPYLSAKISGEYLSTVGKNGIGVILDGAYLDENDVSRLDRKPDSRLVNEFVIRPIRQSVENKKCNGIIVSSDLDVKYYENVNSKITEKITVEDGKALQNSYILCKNILPEDTVARIVKGHICLDGSDAVLKAAIDKYKRLKNEISKGKVSICELDAEIECGNAFPIEKIDEAVDRVIEFAYQVTQDNKGMLSSYAARDAIIKNATYESTVLLKNENNILPLKKEDVVALVGDIIVNYNGDNEDKSSHAADTAYYMRNLGGAMTGFYRGYSMCEERSDSILYGLDSELINTDTVVLFMGTNPKKEAKMRNAENLYLPANQLAALGKIRSLGKKVVAVVSSDVSFDVTFDNLVDALIVAPLNTKASVEAVIDIIMGKVIPSGRLANTLYRNTDLIAKKQRYYLSLPNTKVGKFVGYRYYDSADYTPAYPFGHGLSYTKFQYSNLMVQGNAVTFTVKNKGKIAGTEIAQLYVGLESNNRLRPKKELVGYEKITLQAGDMITVRIPMDNLASFDALNMEWLVEQGEYTVYVGSSVSDIKLSRKVALGNATLEKIEERKSDYLQSETNIISDRYTLEADYKLMKKDIRNIIFGVGSLCLSAAMFVFSLISGKVGIFFIVIAAILAVAGIIFFILEGSDRSKLHESEREKINEANKNSFADAQVIDVFSTSEIFAREFDRMGKEVKKAQIPNQAKVDNYLEHVNDSLTFASATEQFIAFAASKGYKFEEDSIREIFAAMSSSRLIITKGMTNDSFAAVIKVLSDYFGTVAGVDAVDYSYVNDSSALYRTAGSVKQKTALALVLEASNKAPEKVHLAALTDVTFAELSNYFIPFSRYIRNPRNATVIEAVGTGGEKVCFRPFENMWFFMNLKMGESIKNIPSYISELASVIKIDYTGAVPTMLAIPTIQFNYYQFDYMLDKIKTKNGISEDTWKKIDALEAFIKNSTPYVLNNRISIAIEKFHTVFSACGGEEKVALDRALSAKVVPSAIVALNGVEGNENKNLSEKLEMIFGEDNIEISRSTVRSAGTSVL